MDEKEPNEGLRSLLVNEEDVSEDLVVEVLSPYVNIGEESGRIIPKPQFSPLTIPDKILVILLAQTAKTDLGMAESRWLSAKEIIGASGVKEGSIYPTLRTLATEQNLIDGDDDGNYRVIPAMIPQIRDRLIDGGTS